MKRVVNVTEVEDAGLEGLMGQRVTVWCLNYIYAGELTGVNDSCIELTNASIVYETGAVSVSGYVTVEAFKDPIFIMMRCIESFMLEA